MQVWAGCVSSRPQRRIFSYLSQLPQAPEFLSRGVSSHLQTSNGQRECSCRIPPALPPLLHLQGPTWVCKVHLDNGGSCPRLSLSWPVNSIPAATLILTCRATTYPQVWGIRMRTSLRRGILPTIESISVPLIPGAAGGGGQIWYFLMFQSNGKDIKLFLWPYL